jgi:type IV secretion system protein TrbG
MPSLAVRLTLLSALTSTLLSACVVGDKPLLPALPADRQLSRQGEAAILWPDERPRPAPTPPVPPVAAAEAPLDLRPVRLEPRPAGKPVAPARLLRDANAAALVLPSREGFFGGRAEQRFIYQPGKVYVITSAPQHPTTIHLPPGERLAAGPVVNACTEGDGGQGDGGCWVVGAAEMGDGPLRHEVVILRPSRAGLESTMPLLTMSGRAYYCRLRSQEAIGLVSVTWELPVVVSVPTEASPAAPPARSAARTAPAPVISLDRLFTNYVISVASAQRPPWVPVGAFDTGTVTVIRFKDHLHYTAAPAVFGVYADRTPALVEFTPYESPDGSLAYVVQGLYPELRLKGADGMEVKIVRGISGT